MRAFCTSQMSAGIVDIMCAATLNQSDSVVQNNSQRDHITAQLEQWVQCSTSDSATETESRGSVLIVGAAGTGKTQAALHTLLTAICTYGDTRALLCVANRKVADALIPQVVEQLGATYTARPVTTLSAFAFQCAMQLATINGDKPVKLLNGAQQDAVIRNVLAQHMLHVLRGDSCRLCTIIREYFNSADWISIIHPTAHTYALQISQAQLQHQLAQGISDSFIDQMRDMFARIGELGLREGDERQVIEEIASADADSRSVSLGARFAAQWRLAFALRDEYQQEVARTYPEEHRADATALIELGIHAVQELDVDVLPAVLIVDDAQDMTLAQLRLITVLYQRGVRIALTANPDESVQSFRGAFPEYVLARVTDTDQANAELDHIMHPFTPLVDNNLGRIHARVLRLDAQAAEQDTPFLDRVISRVSLSIQTQLDSQVPLTQRWGKAPQYDGALPITRNDLWVHDRQQDVLYKQSVRGAIYQTEFNEQQAIVDTMRAYHAQGQPWHTMAVIAHDNTQVQQLGAALREQGIPVQFATRSTPLAQDDTVQGLFALIRLALWRARGGKHEGATAQSVPEVMREITAQLRTVMESPLCTVAPLVDVDKKSAQSDESSDAPVDAATDGAGSATAVDETADAANTDSANADTTTATANASQEPVTLLGNQWHSMQQMLRIIAQVAQVASSEEQQFQTLAQAWRSLAQALTYQYESAVFTSNDPHIQIDNTLTIDTAADEAMSENLQGVASQSTAQPQDAASQNAAVQHAAQSLSVEALLVLAVTRQEYADQLVDLVRTICGKRGNRRLVQTVKRVFAAIDKVAKTIQKSELQQSALAVPSFDAAQPLASAANPAQVLSDAWSAIHVDTFWQQLALQGVSDETLWEEESGSNLVRTTSLMHTADEANHRLDMVIRLFAHADEAPLGMNIEQFMQHMNTLRLEADSLVNHTPQLDAVLLTTPAGAVGLIRDYVWIPSVQQDVWPNVTPRGTLFGIEDLAQRVIFGTDIRTAYDNPFARVLASEQRLFLVALSRARKQVLLSAVQHDELQPSDFLSTYIPELFAIQTQDSENSESADATENAENADAALGQLQDPRALVALARQYAVQTDREQDKQRAEDAVHALALLADEHYDIAHPNTWSFVQDAILPSSGTTDENIEARDNAQDDTQDSAHDAITANLSPSDVNSLDACAICWKMSRDFAGPMLSTSFQQLGNLVHAVFEQATLNGIDLPAYQQEHYLGDEEAQITQCAQELEDIVEQLRVTNLAQDGKEAYLQAVQEEELHATLHNVATYFIQSNNPEYNINTKLFPKKPAPSPRIGALDYVLAEQHFDATISMTQLCQVANAQLQAALASSEYGDAQAQIALSTEQFLALAQMLTPPWQTDAVHPIDITKLRIHLYGSIDRMEMRTLDDGKQLVRIIDYKTGTDFDRSKLFNDLQLACYQLGIHFGHFVAGEHESERVALQDVSLHDLETRARRSVVGQSSLFVVKEKTQPAQSNGAEAAYQPPLIVTPGADNRFQNRSGITQLNVVWAPPEFAEDVPEGFDAQTWQYIRAIAGTQGMWAVSMISKIIRAAVGSQSEVFTMTQVPEAHLKYCKFDTVCPACAQQVSTVMEEC